MGPAPLGIGIVEGFYGRPWTWKNREDSALRLQQLGGRFYLYAPKGDPYLRKQWTEKFPEDAATGLRAFGTSLKKKGLSFGVGLSPYELYRSFDSNARVALRSKLEEIQALGADHVALLFDDMRGDLPELAKLQAKIVHFVQEQRLFPTLSFCPTYYSTDSVLDRVFGNRPVNYLKEIAELIDSEVHFFWTGEEICSKSYPSSHLKEVTHILGRKPFLWDNYPVNDGQRMCKFLYLKAAGTRPARLGTELVGHAVNPLNQSDLSWLPIRTLFESYGKEWSDEMASDSTFLMDSWRRSARLELGTAFAAALEEDLVLFSEVGLDGFTEELRAGLKKKYAEFAAPAATEIREWLDGKYNVTRELVLTQ